MLCRSLSHKETNKNFKNQKKKKQKTKNLLEVANDAFTVCRIVKGVCLKGKALDVSAGWGVCVLEAGTSLCPG